MCSAPRFSRRRRRASSQASPVLSRRRGSRGAIASGRMPMRERRRPPAARPRAPAGRPSSSTPAARADASPGRRLIAGLPMNCATLTFAGLRVELGGRAELQDVAGVHHGDAVRHGHRLDLVVGDVDEGRAEALVQLGELGAHVDAQLRVEVRQRLVHRGRRRDARTMARPSATRWRWPPESCAGRRSSSAPSWSCCRDRVDLALDAAHDRAAPPRQQPDQRQALPAGAAAT